MLIRMLRTEKSSPDGIRVETYEAGKKYDFPEYRARAFIVAGWAEEDKDLGGASETKDAVPSRRKRKTMTEEAKWLHT